MQPASVTNLKPTLTLDDLISKTADLPSMPTAVLAVMKEVESPTSSAHTVARALAQDQSLSVRVLRLANSAFYGLPRQVSEVSEAVVLLGMRCVKNLALVASTYPWLTNPLRGYALGPKEMWNHSFGVAVGAEVVARRTGVVPPDEAFTAGLLHNIGKVALSVWLEEKLVAMFVLAARDNLTFDQVERKVLGYDHAEVGAHMGASWNLPRSLTDAMLYHHRPQDCTPTSPLVDCVHVADFLSMCMGFGLGGDGLRYEVNEESFVRLGLSPDNLDPLAEEFLQIHEKQSAAFEFE